MPGSGVNLLWDETKPAEADIADAPVFRSLETSLRNGLAQEHNWPSATGANFGYHLLGSCRPFYDVESNVSSAGTDGRLLVTSDTSRFFHVGSGGTMFLGGQTVLSMGSSPVGGQRYYWAVEPGLGRTTGVGALLTATIANSGFSGVPFVTVSALDPNQNGYNANLQAVSTTQITIASYDKTGASLSGITVQYISIGTRVL